MPALRDALDRFRRAGTPGPAARAGVPVDRVAEAAAELEQVFTALADTQSEGRRIRADAARRADEIGREAQQRATQRVADARGRAKSARAEAAATERVKTDAEAAKLSADAARQVARIGAVSGERMPGYVVRVVNLVLGAGPGTDGPREAAGSP
jgi:hypothetical protein